MKFLYQARTREGELKSGTIEATTKALALELLKSKDLVVVNVEQEESGSILRKNIADFGFVSKKDILFFTRELAIMVEARVPLIEALKTLQLQLKNKYLKDVIEKIVRAVEAGSSLSVAMANYPRIFSVFYTSMVKSAEAAGTLEATLNYLADYIESQYYLSSRIKGALLYPAFVVVTMLIISFLMLTFVVPQITSFLEGQGGRIPLATRFLISASKVARTAWWMILLALSGFVAFVYFLKGTKNGRNAFDNILIKVPIFGGILKKAYLARLAGNLSTLLKGGVPIIKSLEITAEVVGNSVYAKVVKQGAEALRGGKNLGAVFENEKNIPPSLSQAIKIGEKTGKLDHVLERMHYFYEKDVARTIEVLPQLLEPILIGVIGIAVAFLVFAVLLPVYNLTSTI